MAMGFGTRAATALLLAAGTAATAQDALRPVPYWASIAAGDALMRTGPGANYPATWRYRRADLPVIVLQIHESWRRVRDPDGVEGWMASALLAKRRTAIVTGAIRPMLIRPAEGAKLAWRVEPGVVGRIGHCGAGWCAIEVGGKSGYIRSAHLWGVARDEVVD